MQTFLPYPSFAESAAVLDTPRLGKQRVETLQILRALIVPTYGWQRHPAVQMWRGYVPALTAYGLVMTDTWRERGYGDTVREQLVEFAPEVDGRAQDELAAAGLLPPWLGDEELHRSHRSRLVAKDPAFYGPAFPGTPDDLDYHWPHPDHAAPTPPVEPLWVLRVDDLPTWREAGLVGIPLLNPRPMLRKRGTDPETGEALPPVPRSSPAWRQQLQQLEEQIEPGTVVAVLGEDPALLHLAEITGPLATVTIDGVDFAARAARYEGNVERSALPVPAALQNPRRLFAVEPPRSRERQAPAAILHP
jgi:hypothetical protein